MSRKKFNPYDLNHVAQVHNLNMSSDRDEVHAMREERAYQQGFADGKRTSGSELADLRGAIQLLREAICGEGASFVGLDELIDIAQAHRRKALLLNATRQDDWRPIHGHDGSPESVLRPHRVWGPMAVTFRPHAGRFDIRKPTWMLADLSNTYPDDAFLPLWMPLPAPPAKEADRG